MTVDHMNNCHITLKNKHTKKQSKQTEGQANGQIKIGLSLDSAVEKNQLQQDTNLIKMI